MVCNKKGLAKTSATPGKTQLINHFEITSIHSPPLRGGKKGGRSENWYLVDLPGYGYATVSKKARHNWSNIIESYIRKRENLVSLFVLLDSRHSPQSIDREFVNKLGEWEIPFALVFTKTDKNKPGATERNVNGFLDELKESWQQLPPYFITSATKKTGRKAMLSYIGELNNRLLRT